MGGTFLHYGWIPPAAGPDRLAALEAAGHDELQAAKKVFNLALDRSGCQQRHLTESPKAPWWIYKGKNKPLPACAVQPRSQAGETEARLALSHAVNSFNILEDLPDASDSHRLVHEIGAFISWHYGCKIELKDGLWRWRCPATLSHLRIGLSAGFTATRVCSICDQDISVCDHLPDQRYRVAVDGGSDCACGTPSCKLHKPGDFADLYPAALIKEADLHEVSTVARPRDPLARISEISFAMDRMSAMLGKMPIPSSVSALSCHHCRQVCTGLWSDADVRTVFAAQLRGEDDISETADDGLASQPRAAPYPRNRD
ncbi:hypothetical protein J2S43_007263 [Catenuloplanes nepalensis]|uniref:Uncharacterized protein n=1 Tax=Catenuloplanes nepalensis TaxID=587533 RepID=A0ABT9N5Q1_9ACTN|nr:hypothetical protein [Catenuloplanes nepalensis]MDP9798751.1 hypothetical protein [Catenuloplanes nepalensis]